MTADRPEPPALPRRIGLVAGGGSLPLEVIRGAHRLGVEVACAGIRLEVWPEVAREAEVFRSIGLLSFSKSLRFFRRQGVRELIWAGWVRKERLLTLRGLLHHLPDLRALRFIHRRLRHTDRQSQTLMAMVANEFEEAGFEITDSTRFCPELLAPEGVLGRHRPTGKQLEDVAFGWRIAKRMADLDVGQSVAVYKKATVAVEGMEGTDRNIERAGSLCKGGFTVVKLAMDRHDMRFDVPTIGPGTIETMQRAGGAVLAVEAGKTLVLERQRVIELADRAGIVVIALAGPPDAPSS